MLRKALEEGILKQNDTEHVEIEVLLEDGTVYPHKRRLLFSGVAVDPSTAQVTLRGEIDNPDEILLPGMYVRVRLQQGMDESALLVPRQAIQRTPDGLNTLMVVRDGVVNPVAVAVGPDFENGALIYKGLQAGDMVVVEGFQKIRPGAPVQPMPWNPGGQAQNGNAAQGAAGGQNADQNADQSGNQQTESQGASQGQAGAAAAPTTATAKD